MPDKLRDEAVACLTSGVAKPATENHVALVTVKVAHTAIWAFFAGCILLLPVLAWLGRFRLGAVLSALVLVECCVLVANRWRCPLTDVAQNYSDDRSPNFDIYLPNWLAGHNKAVFGLLFLVNEAVFLIAWMRAYQGRPSSILIRFMSEKHSDFRKIYLDKRDSDAYL